MNTPKVIASLHSLYPGKAIIRNPKNNPTEIVCEVEPSTAHPDYSNAVAIIDKSAVHYHKKSTEVYTVTRGELSLFLNGKKKILKTGETCEIPPGTVHWAKGYETWVETYSKPGWTPEDHILVDIDTI